MESQPNNCMIRTANKLNRVQNNDVDQCEHAMGTEHLLYVCINFLRNLMSLNTLLACV